MNLRDYLPKVNRDRPNLDASWVGVERSNTQTGKVWRCVLIHHLTGAENAGNHNVYVDLIDAKGNLVSHPSASLGWTWEGRGANEPAPPKAFDKTGNEPATNLDIYKGQHVTVWVIAAEDTDRVTNLRSDPPLGEEPGNTLYHHSYYVVFQLTDAATTTAPLFAIGDSIRALYAVNVRSTPGLTGNISGQMQPGTAVKVTGGPQSASGLTWWEAAGGWVAQVAQDGTPLFEKVQPQSDWDKAISFVLRWEGGYSNNSADPGGETNYGISKRSYPNLDIRNLTREQAIAIYWRDYWQASGADKLPWPMSVVHFDSAVNCGVGQAGKWYATANGNATAYLGMRLDFYTRIGGWASFGAAWVRRVADLMSLF